MHALPTLITDLTLIAIYAGITTLLFKWLKQPLVLGYVLAGLIAGPYLTFFPSVTDKENITIWADIGVIFLLFSLGLEFSFTKILNVGKTAIIAGLTNIIFMLFLGYNAGLLLGWTSVDSLFLGGMISMSSTTIIIKAFEEMNMKKQKFTDLVFGVLVIEDMVGILLLVLLPTVALSQSVNTQELLFSTLKLIFFLVLCFVTGTYLVPSFLKKVLPVLTDEMLLIISIALCLSMVLMATTSGFSSALGAFIMGSILAGSEAVHRIENVMKPVKDFFGAVFFVSVGMLVNPAMFVEYAFPILCLTVLVITGIVFFSCIGFTISGQSLKTAILCGFSLAQVGEFAFIIASLGLTLGVLSDRVYPIIVAVSVITTFTTPMMIKSAIPFYKWLYNILPSKIKDFVDRNKNAVPLETEETKSLWNDLFKSYFLHLSLFSIILIGIMNMSFYFVQPHLRAWFPNLFGRILTTLITLGAMAPFLNGLLVAKGKFSKIYIDLWLEKIPNRLPLLMLTVFKVLIASLFVMVVIHQTLTLNPKVTLFLIAVTIALMFKSQWIFSQYMKIEARFLINLNRKQVMENTSKSLDSITEEDWLDSSLDVSNFVVETTSTFIDCELKNTSFREKYALNIFKIKRGEQTIFMPRSTQKLQANDILTFVGTQKQLKRFKTNAKKKGIVQQENSEFINLHDYLLSQENNSKKDESALLCCPLRVTEDSGLINHSILDADIRNKIKCLVVGIERNASLFINPESQFIFQEGDLIWILGNHKVVTQEVLHQLSLKTKSTDTSADKKALLQA